MLAAILILAFWAYLIWIWRIHQTERPENIKRHTGRWE